MTAVANKEPTGGIVGSGNSELEDGVAARRL